jgi:hypothetical protein
MCFCLNFLSLIILGFAWKEAHAGSQEGIAIPFQRGFDFYPGSDNLSMALEQVGDEKNRWID